MRRWTVRQAFELHYLPNARLSPRSAHGYRQAIWHWERLTTNPRLEQITGAIAQDFVTRMLADGYAETTVRCLWWQLCCVIGRFHQKTNANRKALGVLEGRPPRPQIKRAARDLSRYAQFSPLDLTLYDAWWTYHQPDLKQDTAASTIQEYEATLRQWEDVTGNPRLREINNQTLDRFKAALAERGLRPATVNKRLRHLKAIFRRLGPQETRNPAGLGFLPRVPYTKLLREPAKLPRVATMEQLAAIYGACSVATWPDPEKTGLPPRLFWEAITVLAFNLGLSKGDLFGLKHDAVDFGQGLITLVRQKTGKILRLPINDAVQTVLERVWRPERCDRLFYVTGSNRQLYGQWHAIQRAAGVPEPFFGFHDLRRTCATEFERLCPGAGTFILGHSTPAVTWRHYRNPSAATREAAEQLPRIAVDAPQSLPEVVSRKKGH